MDFSGHKIFCAPLAGITDNAFRTVCKLHGADVVVSEMISSAGVCYNSEKTIRLGDFDDIQRPIGLQLFGSDPVLMARAAAYMQQRVRPDFIDINAGCPVPKVVKNNGGAALLCDLSLLARIISAVVDAVSIPVTVKIRSGWYTGEWVDVECARIAGECGAAALFLHARSRSMGFGGSALWERIRETVRHSSIPVIGNGDIASAADAQAMIDNTGCAGVMIGRAACGNPWLFGQCRQLLDERNQPSPPSVAHIRATVLQHLVFHRYYHELTAQGPGTRLGEMKKHLAWYVRGLPNAGAFRKAAFEAHSYEALAEIIRSL